MKRRQLTELIGPALIVLMVASGSWLLPEWLIGIGTLCGLYVIAGVGLDILLGSTEQVSFGHGAFWAIAAYSVATLTLKADLPPIAAVGVAIVITVGTAAIVGWPMTQLRGHYMAVATLAFALIVEDLASNLQSVTGGTVGLPNVPELSIVGQGVVGANLYRACWALALIIVFVTANLRKSRTGRAFRAVGSDDSGSQAIGIPSGTYRLKAFVLSAALAGVAGAIYALYIGYVAPESFGPDLSALLIVVPLVGGLRSTYGVLAGAVSVTALSQGLTQLAANPSLPTNVAPAMNVLAYGALIFLVMRFVPKGIVPLLRDGARGLSSRLTTVGVANRALLWAAGGGRRRKAQSVEDKVKTLTEER